MCAAGIVACDAGKTGGAGMRKFSIGQSGGALRLKRHPADFHGVRRISRDRGLGTAIQRTLSISQGLFPPRAARAGSAAAEWCGGCGSSFVVCRDPSQDAGLGHFQWREFRKHRHPVSSQRDGVALGALLYMAPRRSQAVLRSHPNASAVAAASFPFVGQRCDEALTGLLQFCV